MLVRLSIINEVVSKGFGSQVLDLMGICSCVIGISIGVTLLNLCSGEAVGGTLFLFTSDFLKLILKF